MNPLSARQNAPGAQTSPASTIAEGSLLDDPQVSRGLLDGAPDAVVIVDTSGVIQLVNKQTEVLFGYPRAALVGQPVEILLPESAVAGHPRHRERYTADGSTRPMRAGPQLRARRLDGSEFPADIALSQLTTEDGQILVTAMIRDVTERRRAERHLQALLDSAPDAILITAPDGLVIQVNVQAAAMFGCSREELTGQPVRDLVPDGERIIRPLRAAGGPAASMPNPLAAGLLTARRRDGAEFPAEITLSSLEDTQGQLQVIAAIRDVSERVALEQELRAAKEAAEAANVAKSEFLSRMSHELRTPLNAVLGFAQLLELDDLDPDQEDAVAQINQAGKHLLELINEVLDIARIESGHLSMSCEPVPLQEVLAEVTDLIGPLAAVRRITVAHRDLGGDPVYVLGDRQRLKQVLLNVLSNAVKYNRVGGRVDLEWTSQPAAAGQGAPAGLGAEVQIGVRDTGAGIPQDQLPRLFHPFERLGAEHTEVEGSGVGLAISQKLVDAMSGRIEVTTALGQGSTFTVVLPRATPAPGSDLIGEAPPGPAVVRVPGPDAAGTLTVLYIEDNLPNLRLMERIVARRPVWQLLHALHGSLGVELARSQNPDLVLLDLHLPDLPGTQVLERLRADPRTAGLPVYIVTADATRGQQERLAASGANGFLTKPIAITDVLGTLDGVEAAVAATRPRQSRSGPRGPAAGGEVAVAPGPGSVPSGR